MDEQKIRVGIIGCGMITQRSHAPGFAKIPNVALAALCDTDPERMAKVRDEHAPEAELFEDYHEMVQSGLVDALSVASPVFLHCPMTLAALEANCHVLCEKPMALSQAQTGEMLAVARDAGKVLQINLSRRYSQFYQTVGRLLEEGCVGEVRHMRAIRVHTAAPDQGWAPGATWFVTRELGGGIVGDIGVHVGDMMQWYGGPVESVRALTDTRRPDIDVVDNATALFRFASGATGVLELSWTSPVNHMSFEVYGSEGILRADAPSAPITITPREGDVVTVGPDELDPPGPDSFECFAQAIAGVAPTPVPGEIGHSIQGVLDAIIQSGEQGGAPVNVLAR